MIRLLTLVDGFALAAQAFVGLAYLVSSIWEKETRASLFAALQFAGMLLVFIVFVTMALSGYFQTWFGGTLLVLGTLGAAVCGYYVTRRTGFNTRALQGPDGYVSGKVERVDERTVVFARNRLVPGTQEFDAFYNEYPHYKEMDDKRRQKGSVLGTYGCIDTPNEKPNVSAMVALRYFGAHMARPDIVRPKQGPFFKGYTAELSPDEATERIKGFARHLGAALVGVTKLDPKWVYSKIGCIYKENWDHGDADWSIWGNDINLDHHPFVIVFAEEMDRELIAASPHTPVFVESMTNYAKCAFISTQLAAYIANLGYSATANHVQHYELILPPIAAAAGLGEVGRLGYLMTKEYGPRVRLSAVTTSMPLAPDKPVDIGAEHFCTICKKCATTCPSRSIPEDDGQKESNGTMRWKLDAESCFAYWGKVGTDCGICMRVCPWSHARTWPHRIIVWLISRNKHMRILFSRMDDLFYGRKPKPVNAPRWAAFGKE